MSSAASGNAAPAIPPCVYRHTDGGLRTFHARCVSLPGDDGSPIGAVGVTQDVTILAQREEGLRKSRELLSHAECIANFGSWERDLVTGETLFSQHLLEMWGMKSAEDWNTESHWECVHPEDSKARASIRRALGDLSLLKTPYVNRFDQYRAFGTDKRSLNMAYICSDSPKEAARYKLLIKKPRRVLARHTVYR